MRWAKWIQYNISVITIKVMLKIMFAAFNKELSIISSLHCSLWDRMMAQYQPEWHDEKCLIWYISPIPIAKSNINSRYTRLYLRPAVYQRVITLLICKFSLNLNTIQLSNSDVPCQSVSQSVGSERLRGHSIYIGSIWRWQIQSDDDIILRTNLHNTFAFQPIQIQQIYHFQLNSTGLKHLKQICVWKEIAEKKLK